MRTCEKIYQSCLLLSKQTRPKMYANDNTDLKF